MKARLAACAAELRGFVYSSGSLGLLGEGISAATLGLCAETLVESVMWGVVTVGWNGLPETLDRSRTIIFALQHEMHTSLWMSREMQLAPNRE